MKKIKIILICCMAYTGIGLATLHSPDAKLSATNYTNYYYRFYDQKFVMTPGGYYESTLVPSNIVYAVTAPNGPSCLYGYFTSPRFGEWRYERTEIQPYAFACLP